MAAKELMAKVMELEKVIAELRREALPTVVYPLWHARDPDEEVDVKFLGVFSSLEQAEQAREAVRDQPGFRDFPEGFQIVGYALDERHWTEGFATVLR